VVAPSYSPAHSVPVNARDLEPRETVKRQSLLERVSIEPRTGGLDPIDQCTLIDSSVGTTTRDRREFGADPYWFDISRTSWKWEVRVYTLAHALWTPSRTGLKWINEFGFVTIPTLALTAFVLECELLILMMFNHRPTTSDTFLRT
jgi:hypothetical protein